MGKKIIGIDIGGSTVKIGLLNANGDILDKWEITTHKINGGKSIVDDIWNSINNKLSAKQIQEKTLGIGVGAPGFVNQETGLVYEAVNIGWVNYELGKKMRDISELPVFVENDANLAALGENWKGAGNQERYLIVVTLGTGVGSGIIVNGSILSGHNGTGGEIGHIIVEPEGFDCNCGRVGCLDTVASAEGIVNQALDRIGDNSTSALANYLRNKRKITAKDIFDLAHQGDKLCKEVIDHTSELLGQALANAATLINPSKILIGGGVSKAGEQLLLPVEKVFQRHSLGRIGRSCEIKMASLGNDAGIIGAGFLVKQNLNKSI